MQSLSYAWDSVLIGNTWNLNMWKKNFDHRHSEAKNSALKSTILVEITTTVSMILSLVPVIGTLVWLMYFDRTNDALLIMLVATLPRQILTIQYMSQIVSYSTQWNGLRTRLIGIISALRIPECKDDYVGNIKWRQINVINDTSCIEISSIKTIRQITNEYNPCRVTIRGGNGTGKSSLLALIKEALGEQAFLLPPHSDMFFEFINEMSLSTGEKMLLALNEIGKINNIRVLLLDEWDANLDSNYLNSISQQIHELSGKVCVVEVRHRD